MNSNFLTPKSHTCDELFSNRKMTNDPNKNEQHLFSYNRPSSLFMYPSLQNSTLYPFPTSRASSTSSFYHQLSNPFTQQQYNNSSSSSSAAAAAAAQASSFSSSSSFPTTGNPSSTSSSLPNLYNINTSNNYNTTNTLANNNANYGESSNLGALLQPSQYNYFPYESSSTRLNTASLTDSSLGEGFLKNTNESTRIPLMLSTPATISSSSSTSATSSCSAASSASTSTSSSSTSLSSASSSSLLSSNSMFKQTFLKAKVSEQVSPTVESTPLSPKSEQVKESGNNIESPDYSRCRRKRKKAFEVERHYKCTFQFCNKAYGTLNHLNTHILIQKHGKKRLPQEFSQLRKQLRRRKREGLKALKSQLQMQSQHQNSNLVQHQNQTQSVTAYQSNNGGSPFSSSSSSLMANSASPASSTPTTQVAADSKTPNSLSMSSSATYVSPDQPTSTAFHYGYKNMGYNFGTVNDEEIYNGGNSFNNSSSYSQYYDPYERNTALYQPKYLGYAGLAPQRYGKDGNSFLQPPNYIAAASSAPATGPSNFCIIGHKNSGNMETGFSNANFYCDKLE